MELWELINHQISVTESFSLSFQINQEFFNPSLILLSYLTYCRKHLLSLQSTGLNLLVEAMLVVCLSHYSIVIDKDY